MLRRDLIFSLSKKIRNDFPFWLGKPTEKRLLAPFPLLADHCVSFSASSYLLLASMIPFGVACVVTMLTGAIALLRCRGVGRVWMMRVRMVRGGAEE